MENKAGTELAKVLWYYGLIDNVKEEMKITCPFHNDIYPSMKVNLIDGNCICFGCGWTGGALEVVKEAEWITDDLTALKKLVKIVNSEKTKPIKIGMRAKSKKENIQLLTESKDYYFNLNKVDWTKKPDDEDIKRAALYMKSRGFKFDTLNECGCKYSYNLNYELIFPILDNGEFKGYVQRTTNKEVEQKRKYLYNEGFSRRDTLCGEYDKNDGPLYIVEGYMDQLKLLQNGIKNRIAIMGWKATNEQINKLKKSGVRKIISALDNDTYGRQGTEFLSKYFDVTPFQYEEGFKDTGELDQKQFDRMNKKTLEIYYKNERMKTNGRTIGENQKRCSKIRRKQK